MLPICQTLHNAQWSTLVLERHFWILIIPAWYINKFPIIDFTIYTQLFLVKLKSVVDRPILHSKSVVDGSILHSKAKVCVFSVFMMVKLLIYHTGMCIKGPESWWIAKSITPHLVVNQSKINPQLPSVVVDWIWIDLPLVRLL